MIALLWKNTSFSKESMAAWSTFLVPNAECGTPQFIGKTSGHKMLAVRNPASFYKSAFNHLCNEMTNITIEWRQKRQVDCWQTNEIERARIVSEIQPLPFDKDHHEVKAG